MTSERKAPWLASLATLLAGMFDYEQETRSLSLMPKKYVWLLSRKPRKSDVLYNPHPRCPYAAVQRRRKRLRRERVAARKAHA